MAGKTTDELHLTQDQVVQRLRQLQNLRTGDPTPDWMQSQAYKSWGEALSELMGSAADLIEQLSIHRMLGNDPH